jgi:hypothetical protein
VLALREADVTNVRDTNLHLGQGSVSQLLTPGRQEQSPPYRH